jgi:hypothetical protein
MAPMHAIAEATPTLTAAPLWERTRAVFARAAAATGGATAIAAIAVLPDTLRRPIVRWLLLLEHVVRKLLFAEAAQLPPPAPERGPRVETIVLGQHRPPWMPQPSPGWSAAPPATPARPQAARPNLQTARARSRQSGFLARTLLVRAAARSTPRAGSPSPAHPRALGP